MTRRSSPSARACTSLACPHLLAATVLAAAWVGAAAGGNGHAGGPADREASATTHGAARPSDVQASPVAAEEAARQARIAREWPLHGLVTGLQLVIRTEPNPDATTLGWLRIGSRIRLKPGATRTSTCSTGWYRVYPTGWACSGEGITVGGTPPVNALVIAPPAREAPLPYPYYFVKDDAVPEYHRVPSRDEQREAMAFSTRIQELRAQDEGKVGRLLRGELPGQPPYPIFVRMFLQRGWFVAAAGIEVRAFRRFVRTVRGRYIKEAQLLPRNASSFHGVELTGDVQLPMAWVVREVRPFTRVTLPDGEIRFAEDQEHPPLARLSTVPWARRERSGDRMLHVLSDGRYVRDWFLAVAERIDPPEGVGEDEPWVHVDAGEQTLVLYRGRTPVYATLVSTGLEGHDTPRGLFTIRAKQVASTMSDIGADAADERYSIEDVPWTEYFSGSVALHGEFWHERFGLRRSHGCVNLAPIDAHRIFNETWPTLPDGWHGVSADRTGMHASHVYITD